MFRKLISNLPFQPALLSDVAFYAHRLRQEQAIRRLGFLLILFGFGIQIFAVAFPPQSSLATDINDIVYGATSKQDVLSAYRKNQDQQGRKDIQAIFNHYGIGEAQIENATKTLIKDDGDTYINTSRGTTKWADTFVPIESAIDGGIYEFPLKYWRKNEFPNGYPALTGISTYGFRFWILLKGCGNIVYEKGAKKPNLEIKKELTSGSTITEGKTATYEIRFRNTGAVASKDTKIIDNLPDEFSYVSHQSSVDLSFQKNGSKLTWKVKNKDNMLEPSTRWHQITLIVKAKSVTTKKRCNQVSIDGSNASRAEASDGTCVTVVALTCPGTGLPIPEAGINACQVQCPDGSVLPYDQACSSPQLSCNDLDIASTGIWNKRDLVTIVSVQPGAKIKEVTYYVNNVRIGSAVTPSSLNTYTLQHTFPDSGDYTIRSEVVALTGQVQAAQGCQKTTTIAKPENPPIITPTDTPETPAPTDTAQPILVTDKKVRNDTQNIEDANNTTANAGDILTYSLLITNKGTKAAENLALNGEYAEDVSDVLEYADIVTLNDGALNKETLKISWPNTNVAPGTTITKTFTVKIKNPLPATPISTSNPLSFDYEMHNKYGRTVVVKLTKPASKNIEQTVSTLPNTGPASTLLLSSFIVTIIAYFYYRNKLLAKEIKIIQTEFQTGGM